jgi:hypothetical protein
MSNLADAPHNPSLNSPALARSELERALFGALAKGPGAMPQQISCILNLSKYAPEKQRAYTENTLSPAQARLFILAEMADLLSEESLFKLLKSAQSISDVGNRLQIITRAALYLPSHQYPSIVMMVWKDSTQITDPASYTRVMFQLAPLLTRLHDEPAASAALLEIVALAQSIGSQEVRIRSLITLAPHLPQGMRLSILRRAIDEIDRLNNDTHRCNALNTLADHLMPEIAERALNSADAIHQPAERARAFTALARSLPFSLRPNLRVDALKAIQTIQDEDERAEALIAFAPHLEYVTEAKHFSNLLEHALDIVISITRRPLRARTLVALAPHLTLDLQGEALAAVHSLNNERERAMLLGELAPTLPPEMLVASLAVAHGMQEQDARVHALTILAHYAPEHARDQTMLDALAAASNLPHHYERVIALTALIDVLPAHLREQTYTNALETTRLIKNENARARALSLLGPHLPPRLLNRALETGYQLANPEQRFIALVGIAPHLLPDEGEAVFASLLDTVQELTFEYKRARSLIDLVPLLPDNLLQKALEIAQGIEEPFDRVSVFISLVKRLPANLHHPLIAESWHLIKMIDNGYDGASALSALAPLLPPSAATYVAQTAGTIIRSIMDEYDQTSAIGILAPLLAVEGQAPAVPSSLPDRYAPLEKGILAAFHIPQQSLSVQLLAEGTAIWVDINDDERSYRLWQEVAQRLTRLPMADTLLYLGALVPIIRKLGGNEVIANIAQLLDMR